VFEFPVFRKYLSYVPTFHFRSNASHPFVSFFHLQTPFLTDIVFSTKTFLADEMLEHPD